ncbi:MAG: rane glycosyltransferase, partial [Alphaproteobacteria bacterium]|nr:rane glycosyltransferase [Alphaproteobacteria bacterium]
MVEQSLGDEAFIAAPSPVLLRRRALFAVLVLLTVAGLVALAAFALSPGGFGAVDIVLIVLFAVTLPWYVIGFWNATIGLVIMRFAPDPVAAVLPAAAGVRGDEPITASTAILLCVRNEPPERVVRHLAPLLAGLTASGQAPRFHVYVLSDTGEAAIADAEEACFTALARACEGRIAVTYRRRLANTGYKAGNIRDFCERWGQDHTLAVMLDADSVMTADAVLRLVRIMQADARLGILQSLVTGMPSTSAFARIFQFGMRLGMRSYTIGSAWWQADCGPYWGHNAAVRIAPFVAHCRLPVLAEGALVGGHVLSHDQIEAVLMRRAGFEVRVLPEEGASWEENPPTLLEFIRRDLRWAQGNMQYWPYLVMPGLKPVSRYQIAFAMLMFLGSPAWIGLLVLGSLAVTTQGAANFIRPDAGMALFVITLVMWFAPKIATVLDVLSRPALRRSFGGAARFIASTITETIFFLMLSPIMWVGHMMFLAGLLLGKRLGWGGQARDDHSVPWSDAARTLWPHTLLGWSCILVLAFTVPAAIPYALFIAGGPALSIPLAVVTSWPSVG